MHLPDGIVPATVAAGGYATAAALTAYALHAIRRHERDPRRHIPRTALFAAVFFVASWVAIPVPPASVHLVLNGLIGVVLGLYAVPALVVGLFFQAVMFGHGGLTTLGLNITIMALPALAAHALFQLHRRVPTVPHAAPVLAGLAGGVGLAGAVLLFYGTVLLTLPTTIDAATERAALTALLLAHVPLIVLEGVFTALLVGFLQRTAPALLGVPAAPVAVPLAAHDS